ncbi:UDP-N-acetylglucosamine 4-epimerase [anaerobic digester metagenome]
MKYIVTGGAGFIGSHIAQVLAENHDVIVIDSLFSGKIENIRDLSIQFIQGTITDLQFLQDVFKDADGIFHQAAITSVPRSVKNPLPTHDVNITGTLNVLLAAKEMNVRKVVFASSSSVYGDTPVLPKHEGMALNPLSPYGVSKLAGEHYCRVFSELYDIQAVSLRYFNVFGPRQDPKSEYSAVIPRFISRILHHESPIIYGDGYQTRDFTYVKDVVQANLRAMHGNMSGVFNIAYDQQISLNELASRIMDLAGIEIPIVYESPRAGDIHDSRADISAARKYLGYSPEYTLEEGLKETIEWYLNL